MEARTLSCSHMSLYLHPPPEKPPPLYPHQTSLLALFLFISKFTSYSSSFWFPFITASLSSFSSNFSFSTSSLFSIWSDNQILIIQFVYLNCFPFWKGFFFFFSSNQSEVTVFSPQRSCVMFFNWIEKMHWLNSIYSHLYSTGRWLQALVKFFLQLGKKHILYTVYMCDQKSC